MAQHLNYEGSQALLLRSTLSMALMGIGLLGEGIAQAQPCGTISSGSYSTADLCGPPAGTDATITTSPGSSFNITVSPALRALANGAAASVAINGNTDILFAPSPAASAVLAQTNASGTSASISVLQGVNNITLNGLAQDGLAIINAGAGPSTITVAPGATLNITHNVAGNERDGIDVNASGGGNISLNHQGAGTISVRGGNGIWLKAVNAGSAAATVASGVTLQVDSTDPSSGGNHAGIHLRALGTGNVAVDSAATMSAAGTNAMGVYTESASGANSIRNSGAITTTGLNGFGLRAVANGGDVTLVNLGAITTSGPNAHAIYVNGASATAQSNINITNQGPLVIGLDGDIAGSRGIFVIARSTGNVAISGSGPITVNGSPNTERAYGIIVNAEQGAINIDYGGSISARGNGAGGIRAESLDGNVDVRFTGARIETWQANANGIYASTGSATNTVNIAAQGVIVTHSDAGGGDGSGGGSFGLQGLSRGGDVKVSFTGSSIDVNGAGAAILAGNAYLGGTGLGTVTVENTGALLARGVNQQGIRTYSATGAQSIVNQGPIQTLGATGAQGIQALATGAAAISVNNSGNITTSGTGSSGIDARAPGGSVQVSNAGAINAGTGTSAGILVGAVTQDVVNTGSVGALTDAAISGDADGGTGVMRITNAGTATGLIMAQSSPVTLQNSGTWNLRNFSDANGDGVRERWTNAVNPLSTQRNNTINNSGTIRLSPQTAGITDYDGSGSYQPFGNPVNTPALGGPTQGQLLNVSEFTNSGVLDVGGSGRAVGNVLVISGGTTPGADGGGVFIANGGVVRLNTVLNEGGANSQSDILVVDSTRLGSAPTGIRVRNIGGNGTITDGNGIAVVEVVNKSQAASAPGAFTLDGRAVAGAYEYRLYRGAQDGTATDAWYLRSDREPYPPTPSPPGPGPSPTPRLALFRPEVAAYLANQRLAAQMFVHSLHDRLGEPQYIEKQTFEDNNERRKSTWMRIVGKWEGSQSANDIYSVSTDSVLIQGGGDVAQWKLGKEDDRLHLGGMLGYGNARSSARAEGNPYKAVGRVEGYLAGIYATWYQNDADRLGAYVDTWLQYGWFRQKVDGQLLESVSYNGQGWAVSGETGYAFKASGDWVLEPQAQLIYVSYDPDTVEEPNGTRISSGKSDGTIWRLGVRTHRTYEMKDGRHIQPYATVNWWRTDTRSGMSFNSLPQGTLYPKDRYELKLGLNALFKDGWSGWVNVAGAWGAQDYHQYAARLGVKYTW
ncbi:autotransporter outer membrane beta-barrel domain-containing protein [Achromobacter kerstersii]